MTVEFAGAAKAKQLREYFTRHGRIYIVVNATDDDVIVPEHLHGDPALRLVLNVRMPQAIIIKDGVLESKLSFSGNLFHCSIPMQAIWAAYMPEQQIENGILWEDDIPETIRAVVKAVRGMREENNKDEPENNPDTKPLKPEAKEGQGGRRVGHLRVIK
ncbi:MAG: ClpXP protease specificity-enhancing factor SspB [Mariprofundaceae bacterium]|nr:ClpXP protease specificity-enhancing factor SspB [Mariprofundaceae bacterium]